MFAFQLHFGAIGYFNAYLQKNSSVIGTQQEVGVSAAFLVSTHINDIYVIYNLFLVRILLQFVKRRNQFIYTIQFFYMIMSFIKEISPGLVCITNCVTMLLSVRG